jgi:hypothetical protein
MVSEPGQGQFLGGLRRLGQRARVGGSRLRHQGAALLQRLLPSESQHLFALTIGVGVVPLEGMRDSS